MKKALWTLVVDNYPKEITDLTFPLLKLHAHKIGAEFNVISERKFPGFPPCYEKFQIYELGRNYDWNLYIDADALIRPDLFDVTSMVHKDTVVFSAKDMSLNRFRADKYFLRDGRFIAEGNWFAAGSDWCLDLWHPLDDMTLEEAAGNIFPTPPEVASGIIDPLHLLDDYLVSRNISRFGLKHTTVKDLQIMHGREMDQYFHHTYAMSADEKLALMKKVLQSWGVGQ